MLQQSCKCNVKGLVAILLIKFDLIQSDYENKNIWVTFSDMMCPCSTY